MLVALCPWYCIYCKDTIYSSIVVRENLHTSPRYGTYCHRFILTWTMYELQRRWIVYILYNYQCLVLCKRLNIQLHRFGNFQKVLLYLFAIWFRKTRKPLMKTFRLFPRSLWKVLMHKTLCLESDDFKIFSFSESRFQIFSIIVGTTRISLYFSCILHLLLSIIVSCCV